MPLQTVEINGVKITFDREKTLNHRTDYNKPCVCQDCRNFYKNVESNTELSDFLSVFGVVHNFDEEVLSWSEYKDNKPYIHSDGYYAVEGTFDCDYFDFERFGVKLSFIKESVVPHDREDDFFFIKVEGDFPFVLDEKIEEEYIPEEGKDVQIFSRKISWLEKIKTLFKRK